MSGTHEIIDVPIVSTKVAAPHFYPDSGGCRVTGIPTGIIVSIDVYRKIWENNFEFKPI